MVILHPPVAFSVELQHIDTQLNFIIVLFQILPLESGVIESEGVQIHLEFNKQSGLDCVFYERDAIERSINLHLLVLHIDFFRVVDVFVIVPHHQGS